MYWTFNIEEDEQKIKHILNNSSLPPHFQQWQNWADSEGTQSCNDDGRWCLPSTVSPIYCWPNVKYVHSLAFCSWVMMLKKNRQKTILQNIPVSQQSWQSADNNIVCFKTFHVQDHDLFLQAKSNHGLLHLQRNYLPKEIKLSSLFIAGMDGL